MTNKQAFMNPKGKLFIFEGPDGVGKSTIIDNIEKRLKAENFEVISVSFPGKESRSLGALIYRIHHDLKKDKLNNISATSIQTLHIAAHIDSIKNQIVPALSTGTIVLLDRYWWSTLVYGLESNISEDALNLMINLEKLYWKNILPDTAFLITAKKPYREELSSREWNNICSRYKEISIKEAKYYPVKTIDNSCSLKITTDNILKQIMGIDRTKSSAKKKSYLNNNSWAPTKITAAFDSYWSLAAKRQEIFFKRIHRELPPWTDDPILQQYKFTNAYRASDRVSQFLIKHVIYEGEQTAEEIFFRTILFKMFNKIETWQLLEKEMGQLSYHEYKFKNYDKILANARDNKTTIYSAAYIMPSGGNCFGYSFKHQNNLKLLENMMNNDLPQKIADSNSMQGVFELLRSFPMIGDFLAYQYAIDLNYSSLTNFSEMSFVFPGPGAQNGLRKCFSDFGGLSEVDLIKLMADRQQDEFEKRGIIFKDLWGRKLQLIDCQNLFCEVDKYSRVAHPEIQGVTERKKIKQKYRITQTPVKYFYPPKWGINDAVDETLKEAIK